MRTDTPESDADTASLCVIKKIITDKENIKTKKEEQILEMAGNETFESLNSRHSLIRITK